MSNMDFSDMDLPDENLYGDNALDLVSNLYNATLRGDWKHVLSVYRNHSWIQSVNLQYANGPTALHMAVLGAKDEDVESLMATISDDQFQFIVNNNGDTPLHLAASRGLLNKCQSIVKQQRAHSWLSARNDDTETPLFFAALHGHEEVFLYLHSVSDDVSLCTRSSDGNTVLHVAIEREHFGLAYSIINMYKGELVGKHNSDGASPLHFLANKPSAFRSSTHLPWWKSIVYYTMPIDQMMFAPKKEFKNPAATKTRTTPLPENYATWRDFFLMLENILNKSLFNQSSVFKQERDQLTDVEGQKYAWRIKHTCPPNYNTLMGFLSASLIYILGLAGYGDEFRRIRSTKERHIWSSLILEKLCKTNVTSSPTSLIGDGGREPFSFFQPHKKTKDSGKSFPMFSRPPKLVKPPSDIKREEEKEEKQSKVVESAMLIAARNGVTEMIEMMLEVTPVAVYDLTADKKNVLILAVENRHPNIFQQFLEQGDLFQRLAQTVDDKGNTVLHYAAMSTERQPWRIPGAALQMQWEIKWYEYVKEHVPVHFVFRANKQGQSPAEIFKDKHKDLVKDGGEWLKSTASSCSVVAGLIATVAFATASQVPGGTKQTGEPNFADQPAFNLFAIASLVSLCFSVTALIMFLAILTSRYQTRDFRRDLPVKLFLGLSSLLVSIASVLVSFCAGHFFEVRNRFGTAVFPIYFVSCLPITFYAVAQFPLYIDLWKAIHIDIPRASSTANDF